MIVGHICGSRLTDLFVSGFVDPDETPVRFRPLWGLVFAEFDDRFLLEISAVERDGCCVVAGTERVRPYPDLGDDMTPAISSFAAQVFPDLDAVTRVVSVSMWAPAVREGGVRCGALSFGLDGGQCIFFDPWHHWGLRIGDESHLRQWEQNRPELDGSAVIFR